MAQTKLKIAAIIIGIAEIFVEIVSIFAVSKFQFSNFLAFGVNILFGIMLIFGAIKVYYLALNIYTYSYITNVFYL